MNHFLLLTGATAALLSACTKPTSRSSAAATEAAGIVQDSVTGTVTYRERIALSPDAVLQVQLLDVSRPDAAATVVASVRVPSRGRQVPLPFRLVYGCASTAPTRTPCRPAWRLVGGCCSATPRPTRSSPAATPDACSCCCSAPGSSAA